MENDTTKLRQKLHNFFVQAKKIDVDTKKNKSDQYKNEILSKNYQNILPPQCDGFCYIGQGGVAVSNNSFNKSALEEVQEIPDDFNELWKLLFDNNEARLTREEKDTKNDGSKTTKLPQLCHRLMIICYPMQFLDIANIDDLQTIAKWINSNGGNIDTKNTNWKELNHSLFELLYSNLEDVLSKKYGKEENAKFALCSLGWELKKYIEMNLELLIEKSKNVILTGAPGTGKTYSAIKLAKILTGDWEKKEHYDIVQFHPSYDYTDFVEGVRPVRDTNNTIGFDYSEGVFRTFCHNAANETDTNQKYVFIIDEINRGEINKIFGELFFAIDPDKRNEPIRTQYDIINPNKGKFQNGFFVPSNVYIIGTMNDIDRSVESIDFAFRRRFLWKEIKWNDTFDAILDNVFFTSFSKVSREDVKKSFENLNNLVAKDLGDAYCIGGSYAQKIKEFFGEEKPMECLWNFYICNIIKEYLRGTENSDIKPYKEAFLGKAKSSSETEE